MRKIEALPDDYSCIELPYVIERGRRCCFIGMATIAKLLIMVVLACSVSTSAEFDSNIYQVQKKLKQLGYNVGIVDGLMGPKTTQEIDSYRKANDLPGKSVVDTVLFKSLGVTPLSPDQEGVQRAVNNFWKYVKYSDRKGILSLYSSKVKEAGYQNALTNLRPIIKFPASEIRSSINSTSDPDIIQTGEWALLYKGGNMETLRYKVNMALADEALSRFTGWQVTFYVIEEISIERGIGVARVLFRAKSKVGKERFEDRISQRFESRVGKDWFFK